MTLLRTAMSLASRGRLSILIFHRVLPETDPLLPSEPTSAQFDALLRHVKARFNVLPLADAVRGLQEQTLPGAALAITFDDGYADNLEIAAPILRRHGLPATVFIATRYLDGEPMWNDIVIEAFRSARAVELDLTRFGLGLHPLHSAEERRLGVDRVLAMLKYLPHERRDELARAILRAGGAKMPAGLMLTRESARKLPAFGVDVGAHTVRHPILANTEDAEARQEITESKRELESLMGQPVPLFAFPNGKPGTDYRSEHVRMVRDAGFVAAVSTAHGSAGRESDIFQLPRFTPWSRRVVKFDLLMLRNLWQGREPGLA